MTTEAGSTTGPDERPVVVVADDEPDILDLVRHTLQRAGCEVLTAQDGESALELILRHRPDLAVLDVMMPKLDGYGVTLFIRRTAEISRMPVIILTALGEAPDVAHGFEAGADHYMKKPFDPKELLTRVQSLLQAAERPPA